MRGQADVAMCPSSVLEGLRRFLAAILAMVASTASKLFLMGSDQQKRPRPESGALSEPPIGIEPMTYSLRVNRSGRLS